VRCGQAQVNYCRLGVGLQLKAIAEHHRFIEGDPWFGAVPGKEVLNGESDRLVYELSPEQPRSRCMKSGVHGKGTGVIDPYGYSEITLYCALQGLHHHGIFTEAGLLSKVTKMSR
jgi:hypothetical protein